MLRFSHMDSKSRSKLSKWLTLVFVTSIFLHGVALTSTAIWTSVINITKCSFLLKYYVPMFLQLLAGLGALLVGVISFICALFQRTSCLVRLFLLGTITIIVIEIATAISAGVLDRMKTENMNDEMTNSVISIISYNTTDTVEKELDCWKQLQRSQTCCGPEKYTDWCPGANNYTECAINNNNLLDNCKCSTSCSFWDGYGIYEQSCYNSVFDRLNTAYILVKALNSVFAVMQLLTYWALYCILPKLHSQSIVNTYKPKPGLEDDSAL